MIKYIVGAGVVLLLAGGAFLIFQSGGEQPAGQENEQEMTQEEVMSEEEVEEEPESATHVVAYGDGGYNPREITVKKGEEVTFRNESSREMWPASAIHPTHREYPGSGIEKCAFPNRTDVFDACQGIAQGQEWSFVFEETGEWFFHDHLRPDANGKIIVQE